MAVKILGISEPHSDSAEKSLLRRKRENYKNQRRVIELLRRFTISRKPELVLEVGCGDGYFSEIVSEFSKKVVATDIEKKIAMSVLKQKNISFQVADGTNLPFEGERFDLVFSMDVIEHVEGDQEFIDENLRVLKREGLLIVMTPNKQRLANRILALLGRSKSYPLHLGLDYVGEDVIHLREYTKGDLSNLIGGSKFKTANCQVVSCYLGISGNVGLVKCPRILEDYCGSWFLVAERA